jgi:Ca-activated chloride channel homolog
MTFGNVAALWLVWAIPILFVISYWGIGKRKRILSHYSRDRSLSVINPDAVTSRAWLKASILLLVLLLMVFSLAGPQYGYRWREIEQKGVDLIIALDCSRSMMATDIRPTRLDRAKREIIDLLNLLQGDRVGLVAFAGTAFLQCPLTLDYSAFHLFLGALRPDFLPVGGTNISMAIQTALSGFNSTGESDKAIILITDGESTGEDPSAAAQAAADAKVKMFCIGVGGTDGVPIPVETGGFIKDKGDNIVLTRLDETTLKRLASVTGGRYVRSVSGSMDLDTIYTKYIRQEMDKTTLLQQKKKIREDRFQWFLSIAVVLLIVELMISFGKRSLGTLLIVLLLTPFSATAWAINAAERLKEGESAYNSGAYDKALTNFIDAQLDAPDRPEIDYNLGNARYKMGDFAGALQSYRQALKSKDPLLNEKTYYNLGNTFFRLGKYADAISHYESALKIDPNDSPAAENIAYVKKVMTQPKPPPQQDQQKNDTPDKKESEQPEEKDAPSSENREERNEKASSSRENNENGENLEEKKNEDKMKAPEPRASSEAPESEASLQKSSDNLTARQAEKMLNRLEDKPGRALLPNYRKRHIEKDW